MARPGVSGFLTDPDAKATQGKKEEVVTWHWRCCREGQGPGSEKKLPRKGCFSWWWTLKWKPKRLSGFQIFPPLHLAAQNPLLLKWGALVCSPLSSAGLRRPWGGQRLSGSLGESRLQHFPSHKNPRCSQPGAHWVFLDAPFRVGNNPGSHQQG